MEHFFTIVKATLAIVITFGLAVLVHEFGHMMFALLRGVGVESFAIGMGPKITAWKWRGIEFSLRWIPAGGFVKLMGRTPPAAENPEPETPVEGLATVGDVEVDKGDAKGKDEKALSESAYDDLFALQDKGFITKVLVFGGGVMMNFLTAIVALALLLWIGVKADRFPLDVVRVEPDTVAAKVGLQPSDTIVAYNGQPVHYRDELVEKFQADYAQQRPSAIKRLFQKKPFEMPFTLSVQRGAGTQTLNFPPLSEAEFAEAIFSLDLKFPPYVDQVEPNSPAEKAGLKSGDLITAVDGKPVKTFSELFDIIGGSLGKTITLTVARGGETKTLSVTPRAKLLGDARKGEIGFVPTTNIKFVDREPNLFKAIAMAPGEAVRRIQFFVAMNVKFFRNATFKQVKENVGGPIAIAAITARRAKGGFSDSLDWFITLNLLLMIFNLLPLPVLDGGFILLAVIEGIFRRPVPPKILGPIFTVFMFGLIALMVLISLQDIINWAPRLVK